MNILFLKGLSEEQAKAKAEKEGYSSTTFSMCNNRIELACVIILVLFLVLVCDNNSFSYGKSIGHFRANSKALAENEGDGIAKVKLDTSILP